MSVLNFIIAFVAVSTLIGNIIYRMCASARLIGLGMQESDKMAKFSVTLMFISILSWSYIIGCWLNSF